MIHRRPLHRLLQLVSLRQRLGPHSHESFDTRIHTHRCGTGHVRAESHGGSVSWRLYAESACAQEDSRGIGLAQPAIEMRPKYLEQLPGSWRGCWPAGAGGFQACPQLACPQPDERGARGSASRCALNSFKYWLQNAHTYLAVPIYVQSSDLLELVEKPLHDQLLLSRVPPSSGVWASGPRGPREFSCLCRERFPTRNHNFSLGGFT